MEEKAEEKEIEKEERVNEGCEPEQPEEKKANLAPQEQSQSDKDERDRISSYHDVLLTSTSILAGFSLTGLLGLPEVGTAGMKELSAALQLPYNPLIFPIVYTAMLFATICFLGVLVGIVSFRLQNYQPTLQFLRFSFRSSVVIFSLGASSLITATVTMGMPTTGGLIIGLCGAVSTVAMMLYRAFFLQDPEKK